MLTLMTKRITLTLTYAGETHDVEFIAYGDDAGHATNDTAFACQIGNGVKAYQAGVTAWRVDRMHELTRPHYGRRNMPIAVDADGTEWGVNLASTSVRNRQAHIIGWAAEFTAVGTAHRDYSALRGAK